MARSFVLENTATAADSDWHIPPYWNLCYIKIFFLLESKLLLLQFSRCHNHQHSGTNTRVELQVNKLHLLNSEHKRWRKTGLDMTAGRRLFTAVGGEALM